MTDAMRSPFSIPGVRWFIAFRAFFNARFYYPVFTILFLDFGLSLSQFALLNVVWAVTIVLAEVPSGALADTWGRRNLLIFSGVLMVLEMALLCFMPKNNPELLFAAFIANRILSGAAEAAASGADEALAYDALKRHGSSEDWGRVLESQVRIQSMTYIVVMTVGAAIYDPTVMGRIARLLGISAPITQDMTLRFPLYLTLVMAGLTLFATLRMQEEIPEKPVAASPHPAWRHSVADAFRLTFQAGRWILTTPFALLVILAGLLFDHTIRMIITLNSQYYRSIGLPEGCFGLIGSGMAVLGLFIPRLARKLARRCPPSFNVVLLAALTLGGLIGLAFSIPTWGLIPMVVLVGVMYASHFFVSHYLHQITDSHQRATVLSFKGLSFNLAYGLIGILYSLLLASLKNRHESLLSQIADRSLESVVFQESLGSFSWYFFILFVLFLFFGYGRCRESKALGSSNDSGMRSRRAPVRQTK